MIKALVPALAAIVLVSSASAEELTGTLKKVKERNQITLGVRDSATPFSYIDNNEKVVGFTIDICNKIVDAVKSKIDAPNLKVDTNFVTASTRIPLMTNGTIDLECGSTTNNAERQRQIAFTNNHFMTASRYVSKKSQHINSIQDLKSKSAASVAGSVNIIQLNKANVENKLNINVISTKDYAEAFLLLETDRAAAVIGDDVQLAVLIALSKDPAAYVISDYAFGPPEPYGIMLRRGDPQFKELTDKTTSDLYKSPEIYAIYKKWFESPVPPRGLNYNFPMTKETREVYEHPTDKPAAAH